MQKNYNVTGAERKRMVQVISEITREKAVYTRMPECAYVIGGIRVGRNGEMSWEESMNEGVMESVITALTAAGFEGTEAPVSMEPEAADMTTEAEEQTGLTISFPAEGFTEMTLTNLKKLISSKASLIKKALNADRLDVIITDGQISFPWWDTMPEPASPADCMPITIYTEFLAALIKMAKAAKRVDGTEKAVESEKYSFRIFLLRLGFGGADGKTVRRELLKGLSGHSAFRNQEEADKFYERRKGMKEKAESVNDDATDTAVTDATEILTDITDTADAPVIAESEVAE